MGGGSPKSKKSKSNSQSPKAGLKNVEFLLGDDSDSDDSEVHKDKEEIDRVINELMDGEEMWELGDAEKDRIRVRSYM